MDDFEHHDQHDHERPVLMLARLEERVKLLSSNVEKIGVAFDKMEKLFEKYVTKIEFWPVKALVFGMAGLILSAVIAALVAGVFHK